MVGFSTNFCFSYKHYVVKSSLQQFKVKFKFCLRKINANIIIIQLKISNNDIHTVNYKHQ